MSIDQEQIVFLNLEKKSSLFSRKKIRSELSQWLDRPEQRKQGSREGPHPPGWQRSSGEVVAIEGASGK